jgi:hypothetical protein
MKEESDMNKLIYEGFDYPPLAEAIEKSPTKILLQELNYKYGLKAIAFSASPYNKEIHFLVANPQGFAIANVWTHTEGGDLIYNYRSPFYRKERGSDTADRETLHSKKLSSLMATLKRNDVVPASDGTLPNHISECFAQGVGLLESHHGSDYKQNNLNADDLHALLKKIFLGVNPDENILDIGKQLLDKYEVKDKIRDTKQQDLKRFFDEEFIAVGADKLGHLVIGTVKRTPVDAVKLNGHYKYETVKPFKRYTEIPEEYENVRAPLLMNKVVVENKDNNTVFYANIIPSVSGYNPDLDLVNVMRTRVDEFNMIWTLTPCSTLIN